MPKSTISTFFKNKMIKAVVVEKGFNEISKQRPQIIEVEKVLLVLINENPWFKF